MLLLLLLLHLQMLSFANRTGRHHLLSLERFADHSSKEAWDYAAWVRVYSAYLAERLDVYRSAHSWGSTSSAQVQHWQRAVGEWWQVQLWPQPRADVLAGNGSGGLQWPAALSALVFANTAVAVNRG